MQTKHLSVLIRIRNKGDVDTVKHVKRSSNVFTNHSKAVLLLCLNSLWELFYVVIRFNVILMAVLH